MNEEFNSASDASVRVEIPYAAFLKLKGNKQFQDVFSPNFVYYITNNVSMEGKYSGEGGQMGFNALVRKLLNEMNLKGT